MRNECNLCALCASKVMPAKISETTVKICAMDLAVSKREIPKYESVNSCVSIRRRPATMIDFK